ncbi:winged helix-turn-helix domain-containing protein [Nitrosomonas sp. Nm132]|uniref:helix-turn-helix domain-containing protein n=1 Tax=Nitrosomonas sp. Nm132 TaxID=1881053 RepID=UPI00115F911E
MSYSESGITQLLCRMGYVYKKPKLVPDKADTGKQRVFVQCYEALKASKAPKTLFISWMPLIPIIIR